MTTSLTLKLRLKSAATFGRGDGVAGLIDREIEYDRHGFPYLKGKTLKGLMLESAENVVFALEQLQGKTGWTEAKNKLFGNPGRGWSEKGKMHVGDACLPEALTAALLVEREARSEKFSRERVLKALTGVRWQTAMNPDGGPAKGSLRAMRVLLRGVTLESVLTFEVEPTAREQSLLVAAIMDFRRAGTGRNRGRGWLQADLEDAATTRSLFEQFVKEVSA